MTFESLILGGVHIFCIFIYLYSAHLNNKSSKVHYEMRDAYEELAQEMIEMQNACGEIITGMMNERHNNTRQ